MKDVRNTCNGKGCDIRILTLPYDRRTQLVRMRKVYGVRNDIQKVLPMVGVSLRIELATEIQMEKMVA